MSNITILPTDILFADSPDTGEGCLCSRCLKPIMYTALRCWPESGNSEYRFHFACQGWPASNDEPPDDFGFLDPYNDFSNES